MVGAAASKATNRHAAREGGQNDAYAMPRNINKNGIFRASGRADLNEEEKKVWASPRTMPPSALLNWWKNTMTVK